MTTTDSKKAQNIEIEKPKKLEPLMKNNKLERADSDRPAELVQEPNTEIEINGPKGLEPTRYGDWESKGRCHDF